MAITLNNNPQNHLNNIELDSYDIQFYNEISNEITLYGQIPYTIPKPAIISSIIDAARYFFEWHPRADKPAYFLVDTNKDFINGLVVNSQSNGNKLVQRGVWLPLNKNISVVQKVYEAGDVYNFSEVVDENFSNAGIGMGYSQNFGINTNLFFTEITTKMVELQMLKSILSTTITFKFNQHDGILYLKTLPKSSSILIECKAHIHIHNFYNNPYFKRMVLAKCKKKLKRLIAGHTFELPGGVTLNADDICDNLEDEERVEDIIKAQSTTGNIIHKR